MTNQLELQIEIVKSQYFLCASFLQMEDFPCRFETHLKRLEDDDGVAVAYLSYEVPLYDIHKKKKFWGFMFGINHSIGDIRWHIVKELGELILERDCEIYRAKQKKA